MGLHSHVIAPYTVMKTPPWKLIVPTVCYELCKFKKSDTDPVLYRSYYSELLYYFTDHTFIFTDGSKDGNKTAAAFICPSFEFSKRIPDKASIFTAELEAIVYALRYIKSTNENICTACIVFLVGSSHYEIFNSLHNVHKTVIFVDCPVILEFLKTNELILKQKLHYKRMFLIV